MSAGILFHFVCFFCCTFAWSGAAIRSMDQVEEAIPPVARVKEEEASRCVSCNLEAATSHVSTGDVSVEDLRGARIEYIKARILQKLRMSAPPQVTKPVLPEPLLKGFLLGVSGKQEDRDENHHSFSRDDFYGKTKEIIIFPDNTSTHNCYTKNETHPNSCFRFRLTHDVTMGSVAFADLWVYKVGSQDNDSDAANLSYAVLEVTPDPMDGESYSKRFVAFEDTSGTPGWLKFEMTSAVRSWAENGHMTHALEISCTGCAATLDSPVAVDDDQQPFIIVYTNSWNRRSRSKRTVTCKAGVKSCCKEEFRLSFSDIGWHDWIVYPLQYDANFCRGTCILDISATRYHHSTVMQKYITSNNQANVTLQLCCTPSKMKPLTIIYVDEHKNLINTVLPNMVVESCDCA